MAVAEWSIKYVCPYCGNMVEAPPVNVDVIVYPKTGYGAIEVKCPVCGNVSELTGYHLYEAI